MLQKKEGAMIGAIIAKSKVSSSYDLLNSRDIQGSGCFSIKTLPGAEI